MFTYITAGESHGKILTAIIKCAPSGMKIDIDAINKELNRRQKGYGRGKRMNIESDKIEITSGVRNSITLGNPITLNIQNKDWENWNKIMNVEGDCFDNSNQLTNPRPGHADLTGGIKYNTYDLRNVLERSSARETAIRTAVGAICKQFLNRFKVRIYSHVIQIGSVSGNCWSELGGLVRTEDYFNTVEASPVRCGDKNIENQMISLIDDYKFNKDTAGGVIELIVTGLPIGLGSYIQWDEKLDGDIAKALMSIQAIKGVEIGLGFKSSSLPGSKVHDEILYRKEKDGGIFYRTSNNAGGIEGGMTNGEALIIRLAMKPIPTLMQPLLTVDVISKESTSASKERSDTCAVPAASIVAENVLAITLAQAFSKKFGGDNIEEMIRNFDNYISFIHNY